MTLRNAPKKSWEMYDPLKALEEEPEVPEEQLEPIDYLILSKRY